MDERDRKLRAALGPPKRSVDRNFVDGVTQRVLLEQRLQAARANAWRRFAREAAASLVVILMVAGIGSVDWASAFGGSRPAMSPGTLALLVFALWAAVTMRPGARFAA